jgi:pentatricopeptide repeat protein
VAVNSPYIVSTPQLSKTVSQSAIINVAVRTQSEKVKSKNLIRRACGSDVLWANVLLSHACSLWYMLLSNHLRSQWNKFEVLSQGMEILDALRARDALPSDEVCYRVLMEQCVQIGRPALAVKVYTEMRKAGVHPSAVTYGFYNKAIMEGIWPSTKRRWNVLKIVLFACFYLRKLQRDSTNKKDKGTFITTEETQVSFQLLRRPSETDISALDMAVSDDDIGQRRGSMGRISRESVYRTASVKREQQGDYAVRGDSFYITDKAPLLRSPVKRVGWNLGRHFSTRRSVKDSYHRTSARGSDGASVEVCLCSCSQCPNCQSLIYDEEIMVSWSEGSAAEYNISCPYCYKSLVPSLTIIIRKILPVDLSGCHHSQRRDSLQSQSGIVSSPQQITTELPANHSSSLPEEDEEISLKVAQTEPVHRKSLSIGGDNTCPSAADVIDNGDDTSRSDNGVMVRSRTLTSADKPVTSQVPLTKTPSPTINVEDTDSSNISHYISLLRGRGHKRISSAPVTLSPVTSKSPHQTKSNSPAPQSENGDRDLPPVKMRPRR